MSSDSEIMVLKELSRAMASFVKGLSSDDVVNLASGKVQIEITLVSDLNKAGTIESSKSRKVKRPSLDVRVLSEIGAALDGMPNEESACEYLINRKMKKDGLIDLVHHLGLFADKSLTKSALMDLVVEETVTERLRRSLVMSGGFSAGNSLSGDREIDHDSVSGEVSAMDHEASVSSTTQNTVTSSREKDVVDESGEGELEEGVIDNGPNVYRYDQDQ